MKTDKTKNTEKPQAVGVQVEPIVSCLSSKKTIRKGELLNTKEYGIVRFDGFDYYHGQKTVILYSSKYRNTYYPFPEKIEKQGYHLFDG